MYLSVLSVSVSGAKHSVLRADPLCIICILDNLEAVVVMTLPKLELRAASLDRVASSESLHDETVGPAQPGIAALN